MSTNNTAHDYVMSTARELWGDGKGPILLIVSCGWFLALGVRIVYPALLPDIMAEFSIDYTGAGFLLSAIWIAYAVIQFPGGLLADRFGERMIILLSVLSALGSVLLIVLAPVFAVFALGTVLLGLGTGLYGTSRVTILSDVYPDNRTIAVSISQASGNVGNAVLPAVAGVTSVFFGWRMGFGYLIPLFMIVVVGVAFYVPKRTSAAPKDGIGLAYVRELVGVVTNRTVIILALMLFLLIFVYQGVTGFLPSYLIEIKGLSQTVTSIVYGAFFATAIAFQFVSGLAADRLGELRAIILFNLIGFPCLVLLPFVQPQWAVIPIVLLSAAVLGAIPPSHTYAIANLPETVQGSGYGLLRSVYIGIGASALPVVGFIADAGFFNHVFFLFGLVTLCVVSVCLRLPRVR